MSTEYTSSRRCTLADAGTFKFVNLLILLFVKTFKITRSDKREREFKGLRTFDKIRKIDFPKIVYSTITILLEYFKK